MTDLLELKTRREIFQWIKDYPGSHQREIQRGLELSTGHVNYHLGVMLKSELLSTLDDGNYRRYYPRNTFNEEEKVVLSFLRRELPRGIMIYIMMNPDTSQTELASHFNVSDPTISYHLSKMREKGVIVGSRAERGMYYKILDEELVANIIAVYQRTFFDSLADAFVRVWVKKES